MTNQNNSLNIYQRIKAVMAEVTTIAKEDKKVNNQYTFVSHDEVARVMHAAFVKHGIVMTPSVLNHKEEGQLVSQKKYDKYKDKTIEEEIFINKTSVMVEIVFINVDNPADRFVVQYPGVGIDSQDKGVGKAISYAVKYALLKTFCLETSDDVEKDNFDYKPSPTPKPAIQKPDKIDIRQVQNLDKRFKEMPLIHQSKVKEKYKAFFGDKPMGDLNLQEYQKMLDTMRQIESEPTQIAV